MGVGRKSSRKWDTASLTAGKSLVVWAVHFGGATVVSLGVVAAIIAVLDLYQYPAHKDAYLSIMKPVAVAIILLASALYTAILFALDYKRRYRARRDNQMVRDLYEDRLWLIGHYSDIFEKASRRIVIVGISLHTLMTSRGLPNWVATALARNEELRIHLVFQRPYTGIVR